MSDLLSLAWPMERLGEALAALGLASSLAPRQTKTPLTPANLAEDGPGLSRWVETAVANLGFEAEPTRIAYNELPAFLQTAGPALFRLETDDRPRFLAVVKTRRKTAVVLSPDRHTHRAPLQQLRGALSVGLEKPLLAEIDAMLGETAVPPRKQAQVRQFMLQEQLGSAPIDGCWLFDLSPGSGFGGQLRRAGFFRHTTIFTLVYIIQHFLFLASWAVIGRAVFQGRVEFGWLLAWAGILLTLVPLRLFNTWLQGVAAVSVGGLLQKRLLVGATRLHPDETRHQGIGQLMSRVFESEAIETMSLSGGVRGLTSIIELIMAAWVLALGAGGGWHALSLLVWLGLICGLLVVFYRRRHRWAESRRDLTHYLVEVMVGHRTRLAQTLRRHWHRGEDDDLTEYVQVLDDVDRAAIVLETLISHGWLVVGLVGLVPAFVTGNASPAALAISLGGVLSAERAFRNFALGLVNQLLAAVIAWDQISPLFWAAARPEPQGSPDMVAAGPMVSIGTQNGTVSAQLLDVHDVSYQYSQRDEPVLHHLNLRVQSGDRILLEGPSGGGKSTLAAVLTGLREPNGGLLLWQGLDRQTLGDPGWRRRVVFAPQFHENHVVGSTFMFNLLMGRQWPPRMEDVQAAYELCEALGLGEVLSQMPAGMLQTVGETGWQLSHGEKSRLYMARALLQGVDLIILDESFAALDPQNLQRAMQTVLDRAPTLMVIAHP
ncbi:MAG: ABC transporter ATP-binding protein [Chloroflexi bacterium]|nr:ABC transporter ATP-binding protein [Chloroflexota bacterium]